MSDEPRTEVQATVRVMVTLDVEVTWQDGDSGMRAAAETAEGLARGTVIRAFNALPDVERKRASIATGTVPLAHTRRVSAKLEMA